MASKQKRARQESFSSQPAKKQFVVAPKQGNSHEVKNNKSLMNPPSTKSKGKVEGILKPNAPLPNRGDKHSVNFSNGMLYFLLLDHIDGFVKPVLGLASLLKMRPPLNCLTISLHSLHPHLHPKLIAELGHLCVCTLF